jgi:hypothetical protein
MAERIKAAKRRVSWGEDAGMERDSNSFRQDHSNATAPNTRPARPSALAPEFHDPEFGVDVGVVVAGVGVTLTLFAVVLSFATGPVVGM